MNAAVESVGGSLNGITARDHGCYFTPIHPGEVGTGLAILGDLLRRPLLREMDVEREVILEEILDEVDADGRDIDPDNLSKRLAFGAPPARLQDRRHAGDRARASRSATSARTTRASTPARTSCSPWPGRCARRRCSPSPTSTSAALPRGPAQRRRAAAALARRPDARGGRPRRRAGGVLALLPLPARARTPTTRSTSASGASSTTASPRACRSRSWSGAGSPTRSTRASTPSPTPA